MNVIHNIMHVFNQYFKYGGDKFNSVVCAYCVDITYSTSSFYDQTGEGGK